MRFRAPALTTHQTLIEDSLWVRHRIPCFAHIQFIQFSQQPQEVGINIIPIFQRKKLKLKAVRSRALGILGVRGPWKSGAWIDACDIYYPNSLDHEPFSKVTLPFPRPLVPGLNYRGLHIHPSLETWWMLFTTAYMCWTHTLCIFVLSYLSIVSNFSSREIFALYLKETLTIKLWWKIVTWVCTDSFI